MPPPTKADANKMDDPNKYQKSLYFIIPKANFIRKHHYFIKKTIFFFLLSIIFTIFALDSS